MNRALTSRDSSTRDCLKSVFEKFGYEVIPLKKTEEQVLENVPKHVRLTVTASPASNSSNSAAAAAAGSGAPSGTSASNHQRRICQHRVFYYHCYPL